MIDQSALEKALDIAASEFPNSVVSELLKDFPVDMVVKFITIYSGQSFHVPKAETIWNAYRNKVIRETLDIICDKKTKEKLSKHFGISVDRISKIYTAEKLRMDRLQSEQEISANKMDNSLHSIYNRNVRKAVKDIAGVIYKR